jgi:predicted Zn-dependent protease
LSVPASISDIASNIARCLRGPACPATAVTIAALTFSSFSAAPAQTSRPTSATVAAARLRSLYLQQAYVDGWQEGTDLAKRFPASAEVRAWYIINYATTGFTDQATDSARALVKRFPQSPWSNIALAFALSRNISRGKEVLPATRKAISLSPNDPHLAFLAAQVYERIGEYTAGLAFLDTASRRLRRGADVPVGTDHLMDVPAQP